VSDTVVRVGENPKGSKFDPWVCRTSLIVDDDDHYCIDVITQTQAVRAALSRVERLVLQDHVSHCVADAVASGDQKERKRKIDELISVIDSVA
jgi:DNA-binding FrmR family transcriptional regulator